MYLSSLIYEDFDLDRDHRYELLREGNFEKVPM